MSLLAYNLTLTPNYPLAAGVPTPLLPASLSAGSRGPALNVTGELKGLPAIGGFDLLQAQVAAGDVQYEWTGLPEFDVFTLLVGSAQEDVDDLDVAIYVATAGSGGNDANTGTNPLEPIASYAKALSLVPQGWRKSCTIYFAPGVYVENDNLLVSLDSNNPPGGSPLLIQGSFTNELGTLTASANNAGGVLVTTAAPTMVADAYMGNFISFTSGLNSGYQRGIRKNTTTQIEVNAPFPNPIVATDTFVIQKPAVEIHHSQTFGFLRSAVAINGIRTLSTGGNVILSAANSTNASGCEFDLAGFAGGGGFMAVNYGSTLLALNFNNFNAFEAGCTIRRCTLEVGSGATLEEYFMFDGVYLSGNVGRWYFTSLAARNTQFNPSGGTYIRQFPVDGSPYAGQVRDSFGSAFVLELGSSMIAGGLDVSGSNGDAFEIATNSTVMLNDVTGTNNANVGVHVRNSANAQINCFGGSTSVEGNNGQTEFNNTTVPNTRTYIALSTPDGNGIKGYSDTYGNRIQSA